VCINQKLSNSIVWAILGFLVLGFCSGVLAYRWLLDITNQETVVKGSYILKRDLAGTVVEQEAVKEIKHLIELAQNMGDDTAKATTWLLRVRAFIHGVQFERDATYEGQTMSTYEMDIRWAQTDISVHVQVQKTLGILQGLAAALQTRIDLSGATR